MSNQAPWSVKGIDPRAREAAREAARRQGLTIGEWLNHAILANEAALGHARYDGEDDDGPYHQPRQRAADAALSGAIQQLAERVDINDRRNALAMLGMDRSLAAVAARVERAEGEVRADGGRVTSLLDELRAAQDVLRHQMHAVERESVAAERVAIVEGDLRVLSVRAIEAEQATAAALARLDGAMTALDAKVSHAVGPELLDAQAERMRERFEASLDTMAQDVASMIAEARADMAGQIVAALGGLQPEEMNAALADMSKRLTAAEKRHTQTIEAVSIEIKRLSESLERRLRTLEARNDDGAATAELRDDIAALARTLDRRLDEAGAKTDHRFGEMEAREAAAFSRMGEEVGRIAERLDVRVAHAEARSAEAIDKVGEQLALMADRLAAKQDMFASEVAERIVQSEERQSGRLSQALNAISARLAAIDENPSSPVAAAMDAFAARLAAVEARAGSPVTLPNIEPPAEPAYLDAPVRHEPPPQDSRAAFLDLEHEEDLHARHAPTAPALAARHVVEIDEPPADHEAVFLEDIEDEFRQREEDQPPLLRPEPPPSPARDAHDPFADIEAAPPEEDDADMLWSVGARQDHLAATAAESSVPLADGGPPLVSAYETAVLLRRDDVELDEFEASDAALRSVEPPPVDAEEEDQDADLIEQREIERTMFDSSLDLDAPAVKEDYLSAARRAAQASAQPVKKSRTVKEPTPGEPVAGLRGATRVILWGAAGVLAAAVAGGVYFYANGKPRQGDFPAEPHKNAALSGPPGSIAEAAALAEAERNQAPDADAPVGAAPGPVRAGPLDMAPGAALQPIAARLASMEEAAAQGDAVAQYDVALERLANGDTAHAIPMLRRAAGQGLAMAQYRLAKLYERGEGVPLDLTEARRWTERAAVAGNRKAMHDLGVYYARGEGAPFDEAQAFKWFRQAAEYGVADSQFNLGVLYTQGRGVTADAGEALFWFSIAAAGGDADARARAAMIEQKMDAALLAKIKDRVSAFRVKPGVARANGDFGARGWGGAARSIEASASSVPRS